MNYNETLNWMFNKLPMYQRIGAAAYKADLNTTIEILDYLNNPQDNFKSVHIAGTNGKGSTAKMLSCVLTEAGYKTGLFVSPYVLKFNERIQLDGEMIPDEELSEITECVKKYADSMEDHPTEFELVTAIGFEYFLRQKADVVVLEAGMGGELDSTNVIPSPNLVIITEIGLDHTAVLGKTIEEIAETKAGVTTYYLQESGANPVSLELFITQNGLILLSRHLISKNLTAPASLPKPASVTT